MPKKSYRWPIIIAAMLVVHVLATITAIVIATSDRSFAVVPNYYQQAVNWDQTKAAQQTSDALGWKAAVSVSPAVDALGQRQITVDLHDADGKPILADKAEVKFFHYSHGNDPQTIQLSAQDGKLTGKASVRFEGFHEFQLTIHASGKSFIQTLTQYVQRGGAN